MRVPLIVTWFAVLAAVASASTLNVTSQSSQVLNSGDSLAFLFSDASYARFAAQQGAPETPTSIDFVFSSLPVAAGGSFTAEIMGLNGSAVDLSTPLTWTPGYAQSSRYNGATSSIVGQLSLPPAESEAIFSTGYAELVLTYSGPAIDVGMPGHTLPQDLMVSLGGGPLSVGATIYGADVVRFGFGGEGRPSPRPVPKVPEPTSGLLFLTGLGLCGFGIILGRLWKNR